MVVTGQPEALLFCARPNGFAFLAEVLLPSHAQLRGHVMSQSGAVPLWADDDVVRDASPHLGTILGPSSARLMPGRHCATAAEDGVKMKRVAPLCAANGLAARSMC
ncbi:hypothetical protein BLX41_04090 [Pseudomonas protegens]|nr:hypothetical protein BLX41_04090 [Pseudomonas protegens]